ncbi:S8 family serine peptidase [Flavobacterium sp.]|uniref:S8 family serine peptidase n=1 Tax=Flavobacterium sp. TaxID=239 RepID=UPI002636FA5A|nr:S8 family serine peptidase [Flavobacterium sp.]
MKKNTVKLFMLAFAIGGSLTAYSQTKEQAAKILSHYDLVKTRELVEELRVKNEKSYNRAMELAEANGWPLVIKMDGYNQTLVGVTENDEPIYIQPYNDAAAFTARVNLINSGGSLGYDLNGQGMTVGMWEPGKVRTSHNDLSGAVTVKDGAVFDGDNTSSDNSHATHVAGTMIGRGDVDPDKRGLAYEANMFAYDASNDTAEALAAATDPNQPILVSNHSYGWNPAQWPEWRRGAYTSESATWDNICSSAPYYQPVFAAGNYRVGETKDWLISDGTSKNIVVVAASERIFNSNPSPSAITMSDFSSYGPTDDRRIKPDIAADGVGVISCDSFNNTSYTTKSGTSMAAPGVAASLLLMQQHYNNENSNFMRASTLRGLMIHTADEAGLYDGPDHRFGWGLIDAAAAVQLITKDKNGTGALIEENTLNQGGSYTKTVKGTGGKMKVTICWTDPFKPGSVNSGSNNSTTPVLANNLDVRVTKGGETFFPWRLNNIVDLAPIKADNNVDNVEVIEIETTEAGADYVITVTHKNSLQGGTQDYALIADGITNINGLSDKENSLVGVYPNPATDVLNFSLSNSLASEGCIITLYDMQGRQVKKVEKFVGSIDVADLNSGVYVLTVEIPSQNYSQTEKIVIN